MDSSYTAAHDMSHAPGNAVQEVRDSPVPLAGPGTTRANRRLQLRKHGFRGKSVDQRKVTPRTPSGSWSQAVNGFGSPLNSDGKMRELESRRGSLTILQEVENSSMRRKAKPRAGIDAIASVWQDENVDGTTYHKDKTWHQDDSPATLPLGAPDFAKGKNKQHQHQLQRATSDKIREAELVEKDHYIDHLESQLAAAHSQLKSLTSPTVTQARSLKVKALTNQVKALQQELADWESRYRAGTLDQVDDRTQTEFTLKSRVRSLEQDIEAYARNARELHHQLEQTKVSLGAAESANMELEKRLETFANIVALSPQKDTFAFAPFVDRRGHNKRPSGTPRFPTTGRLQSTHSFHAMPPPNSSLNLAPPALSVKSDSILEDAHSVEEPSHSTIITTPSHSEVAYEAEYARSESASQRDSMLSTTSSRLSWIMTEGLNIDATGVPSTGKAKPSRRMRRFHASMNPKPLILSTSTMVNANPIPATAPLMDQLESPMSFPFPQAEQSEPEAEPTQFGDSPLVHGRRRAYTDTSHLTEEDLQNLSPLRGRGSVDAASDLASLRGLTSPPAANTDDVGTPRDFSSLGSGRGRNLFEELRRAKADDSANSSGDLTRPNTSSSNSPFNPTSVMCSPGVSPSQLRQRRLAHQRSISEQTALPLLRSHSKIVAGLPSLRNTHSSTRAHSDLGAPTSDPHSQQDNDDDAVITVLLSDICRQPYVLARRCLMRGGDRLLLFSSAGNAEAGRLQWLLLSFLLGPMLCKHVISSVAQPFLGSSSSSSSMSASSSAPTSPTSRAWRTSRKQESKRDNYRRRTKHRVVDGVVVDPKCPRHGHGGGGDPNRAGLLVRHSPWLWIKFSLTLAFAIGAAMKDGPGALMSEVDGRNRLVVDGTATCTCSASSTRDESGSCGAASRPTTSEGEKKEEESDDARRAMMTRNLADELGGEGFNVEGHEDE